MENTSEEPSNKGNKNMVLTAVVLAALGLAVAVFGLVQANDAKKSADNQKAVTENSQQVNAAKIAALEQKLGSEVTGVKIKEKKAIKKFEKAEKKKVNLVTAEAKALQAQITSLKTSLLREKKAVASLKADLSSQGASSAAKERELQNEIDSLKKEVKKLKKTVNSL